MKNTEPYIARRNLWKRIVTDIYKGDKKAISRTAESIGQNIIRVRKHREYMGFETAEEAQKFIKGEL